MTAKKLFFVLLALTVLSIAGSGGIIVLGQGKLKEANARASIAASDADLADQQKSIRQELLEKVSDLQNIKGLAASFLPDTKNQDVLLAELYTIAKQNNIKISAITFDGATVAVGTNNPTQTQTLKEIKGVLVLPFSVRVTQEMSYKQLLGFLESFEKNRRKMQITSIGINSKPNDPTLLTLQEMKIEVYVKGGASEPTKTQTPGSTSPTPSR
jgi:hypothetical protein